MKIEKLPVFTQLVSGDGKIVYALNLYLLPLYQV
jgi:hypothetical protein